MSGASAFGSASCGTFSSSTMMVMMTAITPSLNASSRPFVMRRASSSWSRSMCPARQRCKAAGGARIPRRPDLFIDESEDAAMPARCAHLNSVKTAAPNTDGCEECLAAGDSWVHLRLCRACGHVGCCDNSKNRHATKHFKKTGHPIMTSLEPGEGWSWCFVDELGMELG